MDSWNIRLFALTTMYILTVCGVISAGKDDKSSFIHATTNSSWSKKSISPFPRASKYHRDSWSPWSSRDHWSSWNSWSSRNSWPPWNSWSSWSRTYESSWTSWSEDSSAEKNRSDTKATDIFLIVGGIVFGCICIACCCLPELLSCEKEDFRQRISDNECPDYSADRRTEAENPGSTGPREPIISAVTRDHTENAESRQSSSGPREPLITTSDPREPMITTASCNSHTATSYSEPNVRHIPNTSTIGALMDEYILMRNHSRTSAGGSVNLELQSGQASHSTIASSRNVPTAPPLLRTRVTGTITSLIDEYIANRNQAGESDRMRRQLAGSDNQILWSEPPEYSECTSDRLQSATSLDDQSTVARATYPLPALTPLLEEQDETHDLPRLSAPLAPRSEECPEDAPPSYASLFGDS